MDDQGSGPHDVDAIAMPRTTTAPLPLSVGDRVAIERRIDVFESRIDQYLADREKRSDEVATRVDRQTRMMWLAVGMCVTTLVIVMFTAWLTVSVITAR